ncbi:unnamed protein product, partial [Polarella glacialis]
VWACDKARQWRSALGLMGGLRDVLTVNSCLSAYAQVRHWLGALALMRTMVASLGLRTDAIAFNAAILACSDGGVRGQWPRVLVLLSRMACEATHPDVLTLNAASAACACGRSWSQALQLCCGIVS